MFSDFIEILRLNFDKIFDEVQDKLSTEKDLNEFVMNLIDYGYKVEYNIYTNQCIELNKIINTVYLPILDIIPDSIIQLDDLNEKIDQICYKDEVKPIFLVPISFVKQIYYIAISKYLEVKDDIVNKIKKLIMLIRDEFINYFNIARLNFELGQISKSWNVLWWNFNISNEKILIYFSSDEKFIKSHHKNILKMITYDWNNNP